MTVCTVCGAVDETACPEVPSMVGGGHDTCTICQRCGSSVTTDPLFGARVTRNPWPPGPASTPRARIPSITFPSAGLGARTVPAA